MKQRKCSCGCGRAANPAGRACKLSSECAEQRREARRVAANGRKRWARAQASERKAVDPHSRRVSSQFDVVKARTRRCCKSCAGQPWARELDREDDRGRPVAIIPPYVGAVAPAPVCRRCGGAYSPQAPVRMPEVLPSSAGMAVAS